MTYAEYVMVSEKYENGCIPPDDRKPRPMSKAERWEHAVN